MLKKLKSLIRKTPRGGVGASSSNRERDDDGDDVPRLPLGMSHSTCATDSSSVSTSNPQNSAGKRSAYEQIVHKYVAEKAHQKVVPRYSSLPTGASGTNAITLWSFLPREIQLEILARCDFASLVQCRLVCRTWLQLISHTRAVLQLPNELTDDRLHVMLLLFPRAVKLIFAAGPMRLTRCAFEHLQTLMHPFTEREIVLSEMSDYVEVNKYGLYLHEMRLYRLSVAFFSRGVQLAPQIATMYYNRASAHYNSDDCTLALADYDRVLQLQPDHISARNGKALIQYARGQFLDAFDGFSFCTERAQENSVFWHNRGSVLFQLARYDEAFSDLNRALQLRPDDHNALVSRGTTQFNRGFKHQALEDYNHSLRIDPRNPIALNSRGRTLFELQRYSEALADFEQVLQQDPTNLTATHRRARVLEVFGRQQAALEAYQRSLELEPKDPRDWNARGQSLQRLSRHFEAVSAFGRSLEIQPNYGDCLNNRARSLLALGRLSDALTDVMRALELEPNNAATYQPTRLQIVDAIERRALQQRQQEEQELQQQQQQRQQQQQQQQQEVHRQRARPHDDRRPGKKKKKKKRDAAEAHPEAISGKQECVA